MLEKLGKKAYALPFVALVFISLILGTIFYPMTHTQMKDVPVGVLVLDEGVQTPQGTMNAGEEIAKNFSSASDSFDVSVYKTEEESNNALKNNEIYGILKIPAGFTQAKAVLQQNPQADIEEPSFIFDVNIGKNQMLATQLASIIPGQMQKVGVNVVVNQVNTGNVTGGGIMGAMVVAQIVVMPLFMMSFMASILVSVAIGGRIGKTWKGLGGQSIFIVLASAIVALLSVAIVSWFGGLSIPALTIFAYNWIVSACLMFAFVGAFNVHKAVGILTVVITFAFGMMTAMLPRELMPALWRNWVVPWIPQYNIAEGVRSIFYFDSGVWANNIEVLLGWGAIGILLLVIVGLIHKRNRYDA
ncbi:MAG: ABC transporter permease [Actinomycetaceae bacterium]|nr:ABC transporter permease [Actinomycetaceae bacterium]